MNGRAPSGWGWDRHSRLARVAPLPFVAVSVILVALLLFTPVLLSTSSGVYLAQGELNVFSVSGANWTKFLVLPRDPQQINYTSISLGLGYGFAWTGSCPGTVTNWTNTSDTNSVALLANTTRNPVVVSSTAVYMSPDGPVVFAGSFAFDVANATGPNPTLFIAPCTSATPGVTAPASIAVAQLPITLFLNNYGSGGPP